MASGSSPRIHDILLVWVLINCLWFKPIIFKLFSPLLVAWILYAPIGIQYGYPDTGMILSTFFATKQEMREFFDIKTICYFITTIITTATVYQFTKKATPTPRQKNYFKNISIMIGILFSLNIIYSSFKNYKNLSSQESKISIIGVVNLGYSEFLDFMTNIYRNYKDINRKVLDNTNHTWQVENFSPNYKNYIFVIGESASKHYMSAYGYPIRTTPFFDTVNGTKYNNAISGSAHTMFSVPRLLSIPNQQGVEYHNNILTIANQLNFNTYWLSNQGRFGFYDNEIYYIANRAKKLYYLTDDSKNHYDYELLPNIKQAINNTNGNPNLIFVHIMGSHMDFKERIDINRPYFTFDNKYLANYLSSIRQTDLFLQEIYQALQETHEPFSMIYISDHALDNKTLKHNAKTQFALQVPFFKISSDDKEQLTDDSIISGFGFVWYLTDWLGIQTKNQTDNTFIPHYTINNINEVKISNGIDVFPYSSLEKFDGTLLLPKPQEIQNQSNHIK